MVMWFYKRPINKVDVMKQYVCINKFKQKNPIWPSHWRRDGWAVIKLFLMDLVDVYSLFGIHTRMLLGKVEPKNEIVICSRDLSVLTFFSKEATHKIAVHSRE